MASSQSWYQAQTWTLDDEGNQTEGAGGGGGAVEKKQTKF